MKSLKDTMRPLARALAFAALASAACAHAPVAEAQRAATPTGEAGERVFVTGSHIPRRVDPRSGLPETDSEVRFITGAELARTGAPTTAAALRSLDPSF